MVVPVQTLLLKNVHPTETITLGHSLDPDVSIAPNDTGGIDIGDNDPIRQRDLRHALHAGALIVVSFVVP